MSVTFEEACAIIAAQALPGERVMDYGTDLGDAWLPATDWDNPLMQPVGGTLAAVRKSDGAIIGVQGLPFNTIEGTPVGVWPEIETADY